MPAKGQRTGIFVSCEYCGKIVYQTKTQYNRAIHHFCSTQCQMKFAHDQKFHDKPCEVCGKLMHLSKTSTQRFCSTKCQNEWQKGNVGVDNVRFQGAVLKCETCGKEITVGKSNLDRFDHHFCSNKCRQQWYSDVFSQSDEWREISRERAANQLKNKPSTTMTKPQIITNEILDKNKIIYVNEKPFRYYAIDNYLPDYYLAIEVMGDFWHCNPIVYQNGSIGDIQKNSIKRDRRKRKFIKDCFSVEILYLWESDLYNNPDICEQLILQFIENKGVLDNYNSFNYTVIDGELCVRPDIILPYFEAS